MTYLSDSEIWTLDVNDLVRNAINDGDLAGLIAAPPLGLATKLLVRYGLRREIAHLIRATTAKNSAPAIADRAYDFVMLHTLLQCSTGAKAREYEMQKDYGSLLKGVMQLFNRENGQSWGSALVGPMVDKWEARVVLEHNANLARFLVAAQVQGLCSEKRAAERLRLLAVERVIEIFDKRSPSSYDHPRKKLGVFLAQNQRTVQIVMPIRYPSLNAELLKEATFATARRFEEGRR